MPRPILDSNYYFKLLLGARMSPGYFTETDFYKNTEEEEAGFE